MEASLTERCNQDTKCRCCYDVFEKCHLLVHITETDLCSFPNSTIWTDSHLLVRRCPLMVDAPCRYQQICTEQPFDLHFLEVTRTRQCPPNMKEELRPHVFWLSVLLASVAVPLTKATANQKPHTRQKRLLWLTTDGRLALPPGTTLVITPTLGMPFVRYPPDGFLSNISISLPFTIQFDKLGLTDNQNPYGVLPPTLDRSMGRAAGVMAADYIAKVINSRRHEREVPKAPPEANFHGGERALLYAAVEDFLSGFGMDGKACLLRAICEVHGHKMDNFGLVGEVLKLFFTASRSPFAHVLHEYVDAEESGLQHGECWKYYKSCSKSLFLRSNENKYGAESSYESHEEGDQQEDVLGEAAEGNYLM